ncbi:glycoside hydrolase family 47 protein [Ceratobasidium sp. AG-Ba]|nr:glycoside hydrolase family 47 protein [Ceratobasidium sp. AG-Ba]
MSLPLPSQAEIKNTFSLQNLRSRAGARFAIIGLAGLCLVYYLAAPDPYRPDLAWGRERPPPPSWDIDFDGPPQPPHTGEGGPIATPPNATMVQRAEAVRQAFKHAYGSYTRAAWGLDEILPNSNGSTNNFNGWGVSIIDSISTIQLMQLKEEYDSALDYVARMNFDIAGNGYAPFFETAIRYLGGLASAHALATSNITGPLSSTSAVKSGVGPIAPQTSPPTYGGREHILLRKAVLLADKLLPVFDSPSGLPWYGVKTSGPPPIYTSDDPKSYKYAKESDNAPGARVSPSGAAPLAEFASCQVELKYLAYATGEARYYWAAERVMEAMKRSAPSLTLPGLFPIYWDRTTGQPTGDHISLGAMADSGFEYLLKQYLVSGRTETQLRDLWLASSDSIINHMLFLSPTRKLLYVSDISGSRHDQSGKLEHLSCFLPGLFALGADQLTEKEGMTKERKERYMWVATGLAQTCAGVYEDMESGIGAEEVMFEPTNPKWIDLLKKWERGRRPGDLPPGVAKDFVRKGSSEVRDYRIRDARWLSRPETLESIFLLWRTTKDPVWRERGWKIFQAIEKHSRTKTGYGSVAHVDVAHGTTTINSQPSYFLAETLKYLFLLFSEDSAFPLDRFVFNTEAHPLSVWKWREWEMKKYKIR